MAKKKTTKRKPTIAEIEQAILTDEDCLHDGIDHCIQHRARQRWSEWEKVALKLALGDSVFLPTCIAYARAVIGGRWRELEPVLRE